VTVQLRCNTLTITLLIAAHLLSVRPQTIKVTLNFVHQVPPKFVNSLVQFIHNISSSVIHPFQHAPSGLIESVKSIRK